MSAAVTLGRVVAPVLATTASADNLKGPGRHQDTTHQPASPAPIPTGRLFGEVTPGPRPNATTPRTRRTQARRHPALDRKRIRSFLAHLAIGTAMSDSRVLERAAARRRGVLQVPVPDTFAPDQSQVRRSRRCSSTGRQSADTGAAPAPARRAVPGIPARSLTPSPVSPFVGRAVRRWRSTVPSGVSASASGVRRSDLEHNFASGSRSTVHVWGRDAVAKVPFESTPDAWIRFEAGSTPSPASGLRCAGAATCSGSRRSTAGRPASTSVSHGRSMWADMLEHRRREGARPCTSARRTAGPSVFADGPPISLPSLRDDSRARSGGAA